MFKRVRLDVNNTTDGQQTPWESSSLTSDFYFFGDTAVAATRPPMQMKPTFVASDLPSRAARQAYDYVLAENSVEDYQEFIQLYPQDPLCDRIRALLTSLVLAQAWHNAVLANSPFAYQAFYKKYSGSPYAQNALKLASQPKLIPLSQPKQIFALSSLKLGNPSIPQGGLAGASAGKLGLDKLGEGGKVVTLPPSGTNGNIGKIGTDKLGEGGKIVTLPSSGTNASHSGNTGKIVEMPVNGLNKSGESQNSKLLKDSKLKDEVIHTEDHPVKSFTPAHIDQPPVRFHQQPVITNGGNSFRTAQFHGPALQPMGRPGGGMFMRH